MTEYTLRIPSLTTYSRAGKPKRYRMPPSMNARLHFAVRSKVNKWFRDQMLMLCMEVKLPKGAEHVTVTFRNTSTREMDRDNMYSASKTLVDALTARERHGDVGWGLVPDDKERYIDLRCQNVRAEHRDEEKVEMVIVVDK